MLPAVDIETLFEWDMEQFKQRWVGYPTTGLTQAYMRSDLDHVQQRWNKVLYPMSIQIDFSIGYGEPLTLKKYLAAVERVNNTPITISIVERLK